MQKIWEKWMQQWKWVIDCIEKKGCDTTEIKLSAPVPKKSVIDFEKSTGLKLPEDYIYVITNYAGSVNFSWCLSKKEGGKKLDVNDPKVQNTLLMFQQALSPVEFNRMKDNILKEISVEKEQLKPPEDIKISYGGTGACEMWEIDDDIVDSYNDFQEGISDMNMGIDEFNPESMKRFHSIISVPNGDSIVMDLLSNPTKILYLDHESSYDPNEAIQLGNGFSDFMTCFSNLGCPGPEIWELERFLDKDEHALDYMTPIAKKWVDWLNA